MYPKAKLHLLFFLSVLIFSSCEHQPIHPQQVGPTDPFLHIKSNGEGNFNFKVFKKALKTAANNLKQKEEIEGLNEDWSIKGPSNIGARINTIAIDPNNESTIYSGFSAGGIFKTTDDGETWTPIFDDNSFLSIGDIAIDPQNSSIIYAGTGDPNITGYPFVGDGIYKSYDAGETWENIGLQAQSIISKIIVHPSNSNIIYASAMGLPFERNDQRGFYKSTDGGNSWEQKLFVSTDAGIIDFVLSPTDPNTIYAASWNRIRNNHESIIAGPNAHIYKSTDGGDNWITLDNGLPMQDTMGRIGLAISASNPDKLYAVYVNPNSNIDNIYKTTNAGASWSPTIDWNALNGIEDTPLGGFGWYFGQIRVNPDNDEEIYLLGVGLWKSIDGGNNWDYAIPITSLHYVHADKHDLIFTPNGNRLLATDGGLYKTNEEEFDWIDHDNTPCTQFYRVAYNPHVPDWYFGGAQDNGSIGGESQDLDWIRLYGGDGFQMIFHPNDPNITYAESQNGNIAVTLQADWSSWNVATNGIMGEDRRNWDMQFILSPHNPSTMYTGTYRVYKSTAGPIPEWYPVSEDLTDGLVSASRFHTITTVAESKPQQGLVYVGTTDGNVWRSDYGGDNGDWHRLSNDLPDEYVTAVLPSPDNIDKVYVSFSAYKENDNSPHIFRSTDRGETWQDISGDLPLLAINDIYVLPMHNDAVILVATDGGVFITKDSGTHWHRLGTMPVIPVYDLAYNEVKNEIIAGTFARSIMTYSLDDINIFINPTEDYKIPDRNIVISPNPASNLFKIQIKHHNLNKKQTFLSIYDINGKEVHTQLMAHNQQQVDISQLSEGIYMLLIKEEKTIIGTKKIIVY